MTSGSMILDIFRNTVEVFNACNAMHRSRWIAWCSFLTLVCWWAGPYFEATPPIFVYARTQFSQKSGLSAMLDLCDIFQAKDIHQLGPPRRCKLCPSVLPDSGYIPAKRLHFLGYFSTNLQTFWAIFRQFAKV